VTATARPPVPPDVPPAGQALNRVTLAGLAGTVVEFYDFALFATAAALVLGPVYFPAADRETAVLASLATLATGFLARPLGALLFGHIGDRAGRRAVLLGTVLTTGGATFAMGLLPGHDRLGVTATVLLVVLRLIQGIGIGGEWTAAVVLAAEHAPPARRGLWTSLPQTGPAIGFLLATGALLGCSAALGPEEFRDWGWRLPFLGAGVLTVVAFLLRSAAVESPVFTALHAERRLSRGPVRQVLRDHIGRVLLVTGAVTCVYAVHYTATTWSLAYADRALGLEPADTLLAVTVAMAVMAVATPFAASLGDRYGRRRQSLRGCLAMAVGVPVYLGLLQTRSPAAFAVASTGLLLAVIVVLGVQGAFVPSLFPAEVRTTGTAVSYNLGAVLGGGLTPLLNAWLAVRSGSGLPWAVAVYLVLLCAVGAVCLLRLPAAQRLGPPPGAAGPSGGRRHRAR
jgi:MFS family permease